MSDHDVKNHGGVHDAAAAFAWNKTPKAINPYTDPAEVAPVSALSNLITLYAADNEQDRLRREELSDEVWERYFYNEARDPVLREMEQDRLISHAKMAREQQRVNPDLVVLADVSAEPSHISKPLLERIKYFHSLGRPQAYSRYLRETVRPCLERLARARDSQVSASFRFMASHEGLEGLLVLPEMNQDQVKRLSTLVAAHMSMCLEAACGDLYSTDEVKPKKSARRGNWLQRKRCALMLSRQRLSVCDVRNAAASLCPMSLFPARWRVCCARIGGIANYGRCAVSGARSSCAQCAW